jgi:hypothetical protein
VRIHQSIRLSVAWSDTVWFPEVRQIKVLSIVIFPFNRQRTIKQDKPRLHRWLMN